MQSPTSSVSTASSSGESFPYNMWNPLLELLFHEHTSYSVLMNLTWLKLHSLVILLWIHCATRMVLTVLYGASSGTISRGRVSVSHTRGIVFFFVVDILATQYCSYLGTAVTRLYVAYIFE